MEILVYFFIYSTLLLTVSFSGFYILLNSDKMQQKWFISYLEEEYEGFRSRALLTLTPQKLKINAGELMFGFRFKKNFEISFNSAGIISGGTSAFLDKGGIEYRLTVRPVTGIFTLYKGN